MATGADGNASLSFTIERAGYYQMYVNMTDQRGNPVSAAQYVYAFRKEVPWYSEFNTSLRVSADRESYAPGETAQLIIESKFSGVALLTFERGKVHRERIIQLEAPITQIEVPVWRRRAQHIRERQCLSPRKISSRLCLSSFQDSRLQMVSVNLKVNVIGKELDNDTPDREFYARAMRPVSRCG
jgi:uncharacterized protein YfaS (alpha-2-macroglobulin family)